MNDPVVIKGEGTIDRVIEVSRREEVEEAEKNTSKASQGEGTLRVVDLPAVS